MSVITEYASNQLGHYWGRTSEQTFEKPFSNQKAYHVCQCCIPCIGCIQVSEVTHELLSHCHTFKAKGGLEIKGKVRIVIRNRGVCVMH